jgi:hypothetical protein
MSQYSHQETNSRITMAINVLGFIAFSIVILLALFMIASSAFVFRAAFEESIILQNASDKCHQQDMAVIYDNSGYPICVPVDYLINNR